MGIRIEKSWYFFGSPIVIYPCPNCDHELKSPVGDIGKGDACPECHHSFVVPGETQFQIYTALRAKRPTKLDCPPTVKSEDIDNTRHSDGFYKAIILKTRSFSFDREVDDRIRYYGRFKYFAPILNQNPKIVLGVPGNTCPYCEQKLQKKKCVNCGKSHRSRSSVQDYKIWVNIREEWVQPIDEQRAIRDGGHVGYLERVRLRAAIKDVLVASGNIDYLEENTEYLALERERAEYARLKQWGSYTSAAADQGTALEKQGKTKEALEKFMEHVYIDLNGPSNAGICHDNVAYQKELLLHHKSWDKEFSDAALASVVFDLADHLELSKSDIKDLFLRVAEETRARIKTPIKPSTAFNKLWKERGEE